MLFCTVLTPDQQYAGCMCLVFLPPIPRHCSGVLETRQGIPTRFPIKPYSRVFVGRQWSSAGQQHSARGIPLPHMWLSGLHTGKLRCRGASWGPGGEGRWARGYPGGAVAMLGVRKARSEKVCLSTEPTAGDPWEQGLLALQCSAGKSHSNQAA